MSMFAMELFNVANKACLSDESFLYKCLFSTTCSSSNSIKLSLSDLKRPKSYNHLAKLCVWQDIKKEWAEKIKAASETDVKEIIINVIPELNATPPDIKTSILLDMYVFAANFAKKNNFNPAQISSFLTILRRLHLLNTETPFDNMKHCFDYFKETLICHSVCRLPFSADIFTIDDAEMVMQYVIQTYFKHFRLYKYVFAQKVMLNLTFDYKEEENENTEDDKTMKEQESSEIENGVTADKEMSGASLFFEVQPGVKD